MDQLVTLTCTVEVSTETIIVTLGILMKGAVLIMNKKYREVLFPLLCQSPLLNSSLYPVAHNPIVIQNLRALLYVANTQRV
jgi:hypothetical protein